MSVKGSGIGVPGRPGPSGAAGQRGETGATGPQGSTGATGAQGVKGDTGAAGVAGPQGIQGVAGPAGAKGDTGSQGPTGATGASGSNATATPLGAAVPKALGTAAPGTSANAAREDHVHPLPAGLLVYLGDVNVTETLLVSLAVGMKRKAFALAGVTAADRLQIVANGAPTSGCEAINAYPASAGNVSIGYYTPLLGIGATYSIPVSVYRIT